MELESNLEMLKRAAREASAAGADCRVTPELFICGYAPAMLQEHLSPEFVQKIDAGAQQIAREFSMALVYSVPRRRSEGWHIAAILLDGHGKKLLEYLKVHLYGEEERSVFLPGSQPPEVASLHGYGVGLLVCYDVEFPESVRRLAEAGADAVLVPTALGAGYDDVPQVLLRARGLENQVMIAYANHTGCAPSFDGTELALGGGSVLNRPGFSGGC
ncbi:nitrilase-related carbon-nitrogen hydrolase [Arthrobacter sp. LAPM80]|uniref:nitrilase-related carbon-nitrogen hydrolase n=1 Tax=Arthrobacter sp. LAPM80 TaxID=3141788 RepID=UPI00398A75C3